MAAAPPPAVAALIGRLQGFTLSLWTAKSLAMTLDLDVPNLIADGQKSAEELATSCKVDAESLFRVLRALVTNGFYTEVSPRVFANNTETQLLRNPLMAAGLQHNFRELLKTWAHGMYSLETGKPAFDHIHHHQDFFEWCKHDELEARSFNNTMSIMSQADAVAIANAFDFAQFKHVCDIGGSHAVLLSKILEKFPTVHGTNFDLPEVIKGAPTNVPRLTNASGSFFESVPVADAYCLKHILHDWSDEKSIEILKTIHKSIPATGRVLLLEGIVPDLAAPGNKAEFLTMLDLHMMLCTPKGKERTLAQWTALLSASGFKLEKTTPFMPNRFVIEAVPVGKP